MKRGRPVYCKNTADWERITARAESVGTSISDFIMTCALEDPIPAPYSPLALTPQEQRDLLQHVRELHKHLVSIFFGQEDGGYSMFDAIQLLYRLHGDDLPLNDMPLE